MSQGYVDIKAKHLFVIECVPTLPRISVHIILVIRGAGREITRCLLHLSILNFESFIAERC